MNARLQAVLAAHFDPRHGSPYWLARERELGFRVRDRVRSVEDLALFGPFDLTALSRHPVEHFLPTGVRATPGLVLAETGGTSGEPRPIAWSAEDFEAAFIAPFQRRVAASHFDGGHWLWLGPGGPHVIGRAAQRIAQLTTGTDAFSVGTGNLSASPLFVDAAAGLLDLLPGSPAIDAGTDAGASAFDLRGLPRPWWAVCGPACC